MQDERAPLIRVLVFTHERPIELLRLLRDLVTWKAKHRVDVVVYDDGSESDYRLVRQTLERFEWGYVRADASHGKRNFWRWVRAAYAEQKSVAAEYSVVLPDDVRLCRNFFDRVLEAWRAIPDPKKSALTLLKDHRVTSKTAWTGVVPRQVGPAIHTGWVDGAFVCDRSYFEALGYAVPTIPATRWARNPELSSGVGAATSAALVAAGRGLFCVAESLVAHVDGPSKMHPSVREREPLVALDFVDGEASHSRLLRPAPVHVGMASVPWRIEALSAVVESIRWQCDRLDVYLDGHDRVPLCLEMAGVRIHEATGRKGLADVGKFLPAFGRDEPGGRYLFTIDDDIVYPADYVGRLLDWIEQLDRRAIVGVHGAWLAEPLRRYYQGRTVLHFKDALQSPTPVHLLGTGTSALHTSTLTLTNDDFAAPFMTDVWLAVAAKRAGVPLVAVPRRRRWLRPIEDGQEDRSLYARCSRNDREQTRVLLSEAPWPNPAEMTMPWPGGDEHV